MLGLPSLDLSALDVYFSEEDIWNIIRGLRPNKALGPDVFLDDMTYHRA
jgi:hypothetical protein